MAGLSVVGKDFYLEGEKIQLLSGAIHYFRVVPEYWEDRLRKLKAAGFNCVETYVPWNLHEPKEGSYFFSGIADIEEFIRTAEYVGLYVIVRPSPYICAEWEFGGLPSWLLADDNMRLRCSYEPFFKNIDRYYDVLIEKIVPYQYSNGGPILAVQIENEYGSYGNDKAYLNYLKEALITRGIDVLLFTSDGPTERMLDGGAVDGVLPTVNFGSKPTEYFNVLQKYFPDIPNFCMEYWNGWFDHWGEKHHTRDVEDAVQTFEEMLKQGASVNFYMFHGGTNFGFYNGANYGEKYQPTITSYDYDSPLSEAGEYTPKYHQIRSLVAQYKNEELPDLPSLVEKKKYGKVTLNQSFNLFSTLKDISEPIQSIYPETMEKLGQAYGFILYRTTVNGTGSKVKLSIQDVRDRALVYINEEFQGVIERWGDDVLEVELPDGEVQVDLLVENLGRINYGSKLKDPKGITEGVRLDYQFIFGWTIYLLPLTNLEGLSNTTEVKTNQPCFYKGEFEVDEVGDTFVDTRGWKKGVVFINGFNLGRYWEIGPQQTLYLPGPLLKNGKNELILFELHGIARPEVSLIDTPILG
ncbi:glycoside hydrolase family 35 protein [Alkalihalobacillus sp. 1P02AB]|uniref:glycoside hydrolase family 35 protein n=1 Tax=Alkalihalobacillus sp. 1P02AB TaxID=3132260 RepID=UPI0039A6C8AE